MDLEEQYDKIYRYCYFKIQHRQRAEDITQETFLRFLRGGFTLHGEEAMRFLYTIAHNLCVDEYRKQGGLKIQPFHDSLDEVGLAASPDLAGEVLTRVFVQGALQKLPAADRELLLLRYVNEVPVSVIGELYGISRFSVRRKIKNAVKEFKKYLEEV